MASCAVAITVGGTTYMAGRGDGATPVPQTGTVVNGVTPVCGDRLGWVPAAEPAVAHTLPGVRESDAVVGPGGDLMLPERLYKLPRSALPRELQPYVR